MVYFQTKNCNFGKSRRVLQWKMLVYFIETVSILEPFSLFYDNLVYLVVIWYIFLRFGKLYKKLATLV
jgi:hypothetical protein